MKKIFLFILTTISITAFSQTLTLENIFKDGVLRSEGISGFQPMPTSDFYTVTTNSEINKHNFATGEFLATILSDEMLTSLSKDSLTIAKINSYSFSKNEDKVLLAIDIEYIYRRTTKGF
jgi:dipeptidyl-peptidase-4